MLYFLIGLITIKVMNEYGGVISAVSSTWFMKWALRRLSEVLFKKISYFAMVLLSVLMFV